MKSIALSLVLLVALVCALPAARDVIVMVPDGGSLSGVTLARWFSGHPLALDALLCGGVRTPADNSIITESAAAATAFATGYKTSVHVLGLGPSPHRRVGVAPVTPDSLESRPLPTVLEAARISGRSTGLVVTCAFEDATPAGFAAHVPDRHSFDEIAKQMVHQKLDVLFGGGRGWLLPRSRGGRRADSLDLTQTLRERGCRFVSADTELAAVNSVPVWGLFADEHMRPAADRSHQGPGEPSLAEMTAKAIDLLSANPKGFFLMVEGSQVDWADHANDPFYAATEFLAFDSAVAVARDFAARDGHTLVLAFPDHNCGGMSIGSATSPVAYDSTQLGDLLDPLRRMKLTSTGLVRELGADSSPANIRLQVAKWWGVTLADSEMAAVRRLTDSGMQLERALSEVFSRYHTIIGWTTHGHTGEDVPLWAFGPGKPAGLLDNTQLAHVVADAAGLDLEAARHELFTDLGSAVGRLDSSDARNPLFLAGKARLPLGTDLLIVGSDTTVMDGITVCAPTGHVYGPAAAADAAGLSR